MKKTNKIKKILSIFSFLVFLSLSLVVFAADENDSATARYSFHFAEGTKRFYAVEPGGVIKGNVKLKLVDPRDVSFELSLHSMTGGVVAAGGSGTDLDMSTWVYYPNGSTIDIDGTQPELSGLEPVLIPFEITVPDNIAPGDYRAALKAQLISKDDLDVSGGAGARLTTAIGLPLKISIPGERMHKLSFDGMEFLRFDLVQDVEKKYDARLNFVYTNHGNTVLKPLLKVQIMNFLGKTVREEELDLGVVFPGATLNKDVEIDGLDSFLFWLDFDTELSYQLVALDGEVKGDVFQAGSGSLRAYLIPWIYFWLFLLLVLILVAIYLYTTFRMSRLTSVSKIYTVQQGDTLQSVCAKFQVNSKDLIYANKLKAPYFLEVGSKLLIPINK